MLNFIIFHLVSSRKFLFLTIILFCFYSHAISEASIYWMVFMDRLLTLGDDCFEEKQHLKEKMIRLVNLYYDALDAPKSGLKVCFLYCFPIIVKIVFLFKHLWVLV